MSLKRLFVFTGTLAVVFLLCGPAVFYGYLIVSFELADASRADTRAWAKYPGLTFSALEASLSALDDREDKAEVAKRAEELTKILENRPMEREYWLTLADNRLLAGSPVENALAALTLSTLTGPNEGYVIAQRGIFGITHWEALPADIHASTITNLTERRLSERNAGRLKAILATKPVIVRDEIRQALQARGFPAESFARIGF